MGFNAINDDVDVGIQSIQINVLKVLVASLVLQCEKLADRPVEWMADLEKVALAGADAAPFAAAGAIEPDMMKAAVLSSLEEILARLKSVSSSSRAVSVT